MDNYRSLSVFWTNSFFCLFFIDGPSNIIITIVSALFCLLGICLVAFPDHFSRLLCYLIGVLLIVSGVIKIIGYFSKDIYCLAFQFDLAFGILTTAVGLILCFRRNMMINLIFTIYGVMILADALFKIQMSLDAWKFGMSLWWRTLAVAILTGIFGILLVINPFRGVHVLVIIAGISLFLEGILNLCVAVFMVKAMKNRSISYGDEEIIL